VRYPFLYPTNSLRAVHRVRATDNPSIANKIRHIPAVEAAIPQRPFGKIDNLPYTNSMCTQYTKSEVLPNCSIGLNPASPHPYLHRAYTKHKITKITPQRAKKKLGLVCQ